MKPDDFSMKLSSRKYLKVLPIQGLTKEGSACRKWSVRGARSASRRQQPRGRNAVSDFSNRRPSYRSKERSKKRPRAKPLKRLTKRLHKRSRRDNKLSKKKKRLLLLSK